MHPLQSQLFADHHNFLRLLRCLELEIARYEANHPELANLAVILDIFDYVQFYPERYHHPLEDALFERLLSKNLPEAEQIRALRDEHDELEALTRKAARLFNSVANDSVVRCADLIAVTREFLSRQVQHIERENREIYPLLSSTVSTQEWDEIGAQVTARKDPLFSAAVMEEYRNLYRAILAAESGEVTGATARPKTAAL